MQKVKIAKRLSNMGEYIFAKLATDVAKLENEIGRKVLNFGPGTPDVPPSQKFISQLEKYIHEPRAHMYPGYGATPRFSNALISWYKNRFGVVLTKDMLLPLLGAKDGVSHIPLALANPGGEILIPNPGYPGYVGPTQLFDIKPVFYNLDKNFGLDLSEIKSKLSQKTAFIWVNFPSNPTGGVITIRQLEQLVYFAKEHSLPIVYDNAYSEITFDGYIAPSILQIKGAQDIAVEIGSFSKMSSLAGYRIGWIVGNPQIIAALSKVKSQLDSGLSLPLQDLAAYALNNPDTDWQKSMLQSYEARRNTIAAKLQKLGLTFSLPQGALYIWATIPDSYENSVTYCEELLRTKHVLFTPGSAFGTRGNRYVRVSICINIDKIEEYL
jgi:aspartate/methionine/tyrosine aminotransferase